MDMRFLRALARLRIARAAIAGLALCSSFALASGLLPDTLPVGGQESMSIADHWTVPAIVEITRITGIAIRPDDRSVAFILKQPSIALGKDRYGLYLIRAKPGETARKLAEADYLADLRIRPAAADWTLRGDFGDGVQLYRIDSAGGRTPLVVNAQTAPVGGKMGLIPIADEGVRMTGVLAYDWAPSGAVLWYAKLKLLSAEQQQSIEDGGIVFDDTKMSIGPDTHGPLPAAAVELRLLEPSSGRDELIASAPADRQTVQSAFQSAGGVTWIDSHHLSYRLLTVAEDGGQSVSRWVFDVTSGERKQVTGRNLTETFFRVPAPEGDLLLRQAGGERRLIAVGDDGATRRDYGPVEFTRIGGDLGIWRNPATGDAIAGVHYPDHDGLIRLPPSSRQDLSGGTNDHISTCDFVPDLSFGACARESLTLAPQIVAVDPAKRTLKVLVRPNARYDSVSPLRTTPARWTNTFGAVNDGYVTYPRDFKTGRKYPAILATHGGDAQNRYAWQGLQWEYPLQVFAERGYFILSVNEPVKAPEVMNAYAGGSNAVPAEKMRFEMGFNVIASMEAAARSVVDQGMVDPGRIGIVGYSRGAEVTTLALSHSKVFRAGASGDDSWYSAGGYWHTAISRGIYTRLFGGSPLEPKYYPNYLAFSPSARAAHFSGPLLQQFSAAKVGSAVELASALKFAGIPNELVFYRDESHLFHQPRHRASAMRLAIDWFDFWLLGRRDSDPAKANRYRHWEQMAARWPDSLR